MQIAQGLYEGVDLGKDAGTVGLITYMRTDSMRVSPEALEAAREYIDDDVRQGRTCPTEPNVFKSKKNAQDAHEAIRPTSLDYPPDVGAQAPEGRAVQALQAHLGSLRREPDEGRRLRSDRRRHRSQGEGARRTRSARAAASSSSRAGSRSTARATERARRPASEEAPRTKTPRRRPTRPKARPRSPSSQEGEVLELVDAARRPRRAEVHAAAAALQRRLARARARRARHRPPEHVRRDHQQGAGARLRREGRRRAFRPTMLGKIVVDGLVESQLDFMDPAFTSSMEEELDEVEAGNEERVVLLSRFYKKFREQLEHGKKGKRWNPEPRRRRGENVRREAAAQGEMIEALVEERLVPRLLELPEVQDHARPGRRRQRRAAAARDRHRLRQVRQADGDPQRSLRRVPLVHRLSRRARTRGPFRSASPARSAAATSSRSARRRRAARRSTAAVDYNDETVKCDFKLWQKPIPEPCPLCGAKFLVMGGTQGQADDRVRGQGVRLQALRRVAARRWREAGADVTQSARCARLIMAAEAANG